MRGFPRFIPPHMRNMAEWPCLQCGDTPTIICSHCQATHYCSIRCQLADWEHHLRGGGWCGPAPESIHTIPDTKSSSSDPPTPDALTTPSIATSPLRHHSHSRPQSQPQPTTATATAAHSLSLRSSLRAIDILKNKVMNDRRERERADCASSQYLR
jgi:hypothetical protein